jgi:copper chaperone
MKFIEKVCYKSEKMERIRLKTSLKCNGCVATITPYLNNLKGLEKWSVDLNDPQRILTADISGINPEDVIAVLKNAGYYAEKMD